MNQPPPQLSEHVFRWCEPFLTRAVHRWPEETRFAQEEMVDLKGARLSPHTFAARLRDSIVSLKRFGWTTTVDVEKLNKITGEFAVAFAPDGSVWWKSRGRRGRPSQMTEETREAGYLVDADINRAPWGNVTEEELRALCILLDKERLVGPFVIGCVVPEETAEALRAEFNISVIVDQEKKQTRIT